MAPSKGSPTISVAAGFPRQAEERRNRAGVSAYLGFPPLGAVAWVKKPFKPELLLKLVHEHCKS